MTEVYKIGKRRFVVRSNHDGLSDTVYALSGNGSERLSAYQADVVRTIGRPVTDYGYRHNGERRPMADVARYGS